nr:hypothetical protein [Brachyspira pilosicoli]
MPKSSSSLLNFSTFTRSLSLISFSNEEILSSAKLFTLDNDSSMRLLRFSKELFKILSNSFLL